MNKLALGESYGQRVFEGRDGWRRRGSSKGATAGSVYLEADACRAGAHCSAVVELIGLRGVPCNVRSLCAAANLEAAIQHDAVVTPAVEA